MHAVDDLSADVTVDMGKANQVGTGSAVVGGRRFTGLAVDVGNPHLACVDASLTDDDLLALDVAAPVSFDAAQFPDGVNVEVLTAPVDGAVSMRVHERGVGETRSCGTGTVAAVVAALRHAGRRHRHASGAHPRRRGGRHDHRRHQLPARSVGPGGPRRTVRRLVAGAAAINQMRETPPKGQHL